MNYKIQRVVNAKEGSCNIDISLWGLSREQIGEFNKLSELISIKIIEIQDMDKSVPLKRDGRF